MTGVPASRRIDSPTALTALIREIKAAVERRALEQVLPDVSPFASDLAIADVPDGGPWPDYLEMRFTDRGSGARYKLSVETYHGTGGTWSPDVG